MFLRYCVLLSMVLAPTCLAAEISKRTVSPLEKYGFEALKPLPALRKPDSKILRVGVQSAFGEEGETRLVFNSESLYIVETFDDGRPAVIAYDDVRTIEGDNGKKRVLKTQRTRHLTDSETTKLRSAFARLEICGVAADNRPKDAFMLDGWSVSAEFSDDQRYCFMYR